MIQVQDIRHGRVKEILEFPGYRVIIAGMRHLLADLSPSAGGILSNYDGQIIPW
jgi:hypothetical protein